MGEGTDAKRIDKGVAVAQNLRAVSMGEECAYYIILPAASNDSLNDPRPSESTSTS
jgi:hypothetical protein